MSIDAIFSAFSMNRLQLVSAALVSTVVLAGCDENGAFNLGGALEDKPAQEAVAAESTGEFIEKDVEAPDVFSANEAALWDGRPSLGGIWVAHPDVTEPERVMIRNPANGKFVVGALFRRERNNPGPRLQMSSDAADALDILAGSPTELSVVALRKERIEITPPEPETPPDTPAAEPVEIEQTELDPIAAAGAAIEASQPTPVAPAVTAAAGTDAPEVQAAQSGTAVDKPFIQVGIYNVEKNANAVAGQMRSAGMVPTVKSGDSDGTPFWRVIVGPANTVADQEELLGKIKAEGYSDAYTVSN